MPSPRDLRGKGHGARQPDLVIYHDRDDASSISDYSLQDERRNSHRSSFRSPKSKSNFNSDLEIDDDVQEEHDPFLEDIYDIVDSVVPKKDDVNTPCFTFRSVNPYIGILAGYPLALLLARFLPKTFIHLHGDLGFSLNPGPFTVKEHTLLFVMCSAACNPAYALYNIIGQKFLLHQDTLSPHWCLLFALTTQLFGFGVAGLCRRYLVRPAAMLWPANLSIIALLTSLHQTETDEGRRRFRFFWLCAGGMFLYQFIPSILAPALSAVSLICFVAPNSARAKLLGSAEFGLGMMSMTFDWSIITVVQPITTPLWALLNQVVGLYLIIWILVPALWFSNAFGNDQQIGTNPVQGPNGTGEFPLGYAMNTVSLFDANGTSISVLDLLDPTTNTTLNPDAYAALSPIRITTYFAAEYLSSFMVFAASITHVSIWYGADILMRLRTAAKDLDTTDIHARMMDKYPDCPDMWYISLLAFTLVMGILTCTFGGFAMPWWAVILALLLATVSMVPLGTIQAISGQSIGLNVMAEFLGGYLLPGNFVGVMSFKTLGYMSMYQGIGLAQDLKLGHYLKVPPRTMFLSQLYATLLTTFVNVYSSIYIYSSLRTEIENGLYGWD
ncbi:hypothetical protein HK101_010691, partial [Irineochytrium annulatum]